MYRKKISEYFDSISDSYEIKTTNKKDFLFRFKLWERNIDKFSIEFKDNLVFDLGCGNGTLSLYCTSRGFKTISVDSSSKMIELLTNKIEKNSSKNISIYNKMLPFKEDFIASNSNSATIILLSSVFEYISEINELTKQCYRLLKPGGYLFVSIPNKVSFYRKLELIFKKFGLFSNRNFHFIENYMNIEESKEFFYKYGFYFRDLIYYGKFNFEKDIKIKKYLSSLMFLVLKKKK
jgi:SAM-dependent methyltransferase